LYFGLIQATANLDQEKKQSQTVQDMNTISAGYRIGSGHSSSANLRPDKKECTTAVNTPATATQTIQDGKYEPSRLKDGEWEHPVSVNIGPVKASSFIHRRHAGAPLWRDCM
jgi:hypothetical protein